MDYVKCNHCGHVQSEEELLVVGGEEACVNCQKTGGLMDVELPKK